jgi:hypothetical protein
MVVINPDHLKRTFARAELDAVTLMKRHDRPRTLLGAV